jgi:ribosomal protein S12 methylthiotransferase
VPASNDINSAATKKLDFTTAITNGTRVAERLPAHPAPAKLRKLLCGALRNRFYGSVFCTFNHLLRSNLQKEATTIKKAKSGKDRVSVITLGCEKNTVDSEVLMGGLRNHGATLTEDPERSDIVILNTCGFIDNAKQQSINAILEALELKKAGKVREVYVSGCLSERYRSELAAEMPDVDGFFGTQDFENILKTVSKRSDDEPSLKYDLLGERILTTPKHFAYIKISEGCDNPCSFCAIPIMRGGHRSRSIEEIEFEVMMLAGQGVKEIILIAQDLTYYGLDRYESRALATLLQRLVKIQGLRWIRLMYAYPAKFPKDILPIMAGEEKIARYLDIPVQHASTEVLRSMRRGITRRATEDLIGEIREAVPGIALRTTLIAGYPTEGEKEFAELEEFVSTMRFERLGVFTYSQEDGTTADVLGDPISSEEKQSRQSRLMEIQQEISLEHNQSKIGQTIPVVIERREEGVGFQWAGRTEQDAPEVDNEVLIESDEELSIGQIYPVLINDAYEFDLVGTTGRH